MLNFLFLLVLSLFPPIACSLLSNQVTTSSPWKKFFAATTPVGSILSGTPSHTLVHIPGLSTPSPRRFGHWKNYSAEAVPALQPFLHSRGCCPVSRWAYTPVQLVHCVREVTSRATIFRLSRVLPRNQTSISEQHIFCRNWHGNHFA
ncbi:hypothetical protein C8R43DRAFT_1113270 [Mycena crocata]|nr:hypothetical protein C8R43DRAFT_1113270 [Mycena crocata]